MGSPYLNNGEVIVLTTHRVSVDAVPYEVMLTTDRIFLIDNRNARFEPRIILLSTILSVQGGKTADLDPVITLLFRGIEGEETRPPVNLVFSQNPNENRKPERDDWVRSLIQLSINLHEREAAAEPVVPEPDGEPGLRPSIRHVVAPEMVRPLSNVIDQEKVRASVTITPEEIGGHIGIPVRPVAVPRIVEEPVPGSAPAGQPHGTLPARESPHAMPVPPAKVIIPQIIEELLPVKAPVPAEAKAEPAAEPIDPAVLYRAIPAPVKPVSLPEVQVPPAPSAVPFPVPAAALAPRPIPDIIRALQAGAAEPEPAARKIVPEPEEAPETLPVPGEAEPPVLPEPVIAPPEPAFPEPTGPPVPEEPSHNPEPETIESPPVKHPLPPAREIRPLRATLTRAAAAILVIVLVVAGALILTQQAPGPAGNPVPAPGVVETAPLLPVTTTTPAIPTATPVTSQVTPDTTPPSAITVPQSGVWIRVNSTSAYFGSLGNAEMMQKISATGDNVYKVFREDRPVQVSVQKNDNSGAVLAVTIYRNGTPIATRSVTSPMGTIELLINPETGLAPGLTAKDVLPEHAATPSGLENY